MTSARHGTVSLRPARPRDDSRFLRPVHPPGQLLVPGPAAVARHHDGIGIRGVPGPQRSAPSPAFETAADGVDAGVMAE